MSEIKIKNLFMSYRGKLIINNLSCTINSSYIHFLTGANGSGKTTFFMCLLGEVMYSGVIDDNDLSYVFLPDVVAVPDYQSVESFLKMFFLLDNSHKDLYLIDQYLDRYGIIELKKELVSTLSKGTRQKLLIIKTLLSRKDVYLFDEPLEGLDEVSRVLLMQDIYSLQQNGKIVIIATHYFDDYPYENKKVIF